MAADQRKKRLNASSIVGCTARKQYKVKKKKLELQQSYLNMRSNISLEWDDKKKNVVAKREQISIAQRNFQFIGSAPSCYNTLADVFCIPREIFDLRTLTDVLSYEVWQTHLSETERKSLSQFLPKGAEAHKVVQELLGGDNFHFGNPFLKWHVEFDNNICAEWTSCVHIGVSTSLCSGSLHPDAVLYQEQFFTANKKAYYSELRKYHNNMIEDLQIWKEIWASCKDPEIEMVQKICRLITSKCKALSSNKHLGKSKPSCANEVRLCDYDENLAATSGSCSSAVDEKACWNHKPNITTMDGEFQRRICKNDFMEGKYDSSADRLKMVAKPGKLQKRNIQCSDGSKYMSYIKVSKEQHQLVKSSMKHSSNSIQPRSLNHVLGNLDSFHVRPYKVFEEEERQKLHRHWLHLANRDLPAGFANWIRRQLEKRQLTVSLGQEMKEKLKSLKEDEDREKSDSLLQEKGDCEVTSHDSSIILEDEEENAGCIYQEQTENGSASCELTLEDENESFPRSTHNPNLQQISLLGDVHGCSSMNFDSDSNHADDVHPNLPDFPENINLVDGPANQGVPISSATDTWPGAYYHSTPIGQEYPSTSHLSLGHLDVMEQQPAALIDLESDMQEHDAGKEIMQGHSTGDSFFPYPNQDRHELLHSLFKDQGSVPYHHEQRQKGLGIFPVANLMIEAGQFPEHFQEQLRPSMPFEMRQKRLNDLYMHQNLQENMLSDVGRFPISRQDHFLPRNIQDWAAHTVHMSAPPQSHLNVGESLSQSWFSGDLRASRELVGLEGAVGQNQSIGGNATNADQSLFSVLPHYNGLLSGARYEQMGSTERFIQPANSVGFGGGISASDLLTRAANPLDYLSGHEAASGMKTNNLGWVSLPHENSALQDSISKQFLRSWNH
ncbi:hypothetical protein RJ640_028213 [Escallonia rubra]|uniref:Nuclear factor related to kappa-B-binding protein n=1 Tax=Escallonia rubra TaxID=112253 RepID=A0AA88U3B9_9ASTE|nr:hypothetical protein RJ640_028213 [Escallonia rubra]